MVVYAGSAGTVLEPTSGANKRAIVAALDMLEAGGSTAGGEGIRQAYELAKQNFDKKAVNRVLLATDGDFNVGITNPNALESFIAQERSSGVFLTVLGFGVGNYNDAMMQKLAQAGNGVAAYIDNLNEAHKVFVQEMGSTLFPIAKDVKIQLEFNPGRVAEYRLIGYENAAPEPRRFQQRQGRCRRYRLRPHGDGPLRNHARGVQGSIHRRFALSPGKFRAERCAR
jgi:Ca-activated chloride channel family protein